MMRVMIATDAWRPQINGVVRSLERMAEAAPDFGVTARMLTPPRFRQIGLPDEFLAAASRWRRSGRSPSASPISGPTISISRPKGRSAG